MTLEELNQPEFLTLLSVLELQLLLLQQNIDTKKWTKSVEQLYKEIKEGETRLSLEGGELIRHTNAVFVEIISPDGTQQLAETRQVYHDTTRPDNIRNSPMIGEKLTVEEDPKAGAIRAFCEEICSGQEIDTTKLDVREITSKLPKKQDTYPGLNTRGKVTSFVLQMPTEYFDPNGYREVQEEKGKTNVFEWVTRCVLVAKDVPSVTSTLDEMNIRYTLSAVPDKPGEFSLAIGDKNIRLVGSGEADGKLSVIQGNF
jgi:hypothetical protein